MRPPKAALDRDDVVLVTFPFIDLAGEKLRPALVVGRPLEDDVIMAFISSRAGIATTAAELAIAPQDPEFAATGLRVASRVRLNKVATLHRSLVRRRLGHIGPRTRRAVDRALRYVFDL
ncbi:MAG: type II toxin-antitoxin system PemK/MazF family toxin [Actinobacteria bacterium]|nr:MAG: type II toxin-antitoxin system PemK/MazF family toxin [Actinomycetota bacterium]